LLEGVEVLRVNGRVGEDGPYDTKGDGREERENSLSAKRCHFRSPPAIVSLPIARCRAEAPSPPSIGNIGPAESATAWVSNMAGTETLPYTYTPCPNNLHHPLQIALLPRIMK